MPGIAHPSQFGLPKTEKLVASLASGLWAIDWWEGDPRAEGVEEKGSIRCGWYVRPSTMGNEGRLYDPSWGGRCVFHTDTGCSLAREQMPWSCLTLKPQSGPLGTARDRDCRSGSRLIVEMKRLLICSWISFYRPLMRAAKRVEHESFH